MGSKFIPNLRQYMYEEKVRVCVVECPNRSTSYQDAANTSLTFVEISMEEKMQRQIKAKFPGLIYRIPKKKGQCLIFDWLALTVAMLDNESGWDVTLMTWDDFKSALQFGSGESWDTLRHVDLVLGGVDLSSDFMAPCERFEFTRDTFLAYMKNVRRLQRTTVLYPVPDDLIFTGSKLGVLTALVSSSNMTGVSYPLVVTCPPPDHETFKTMPQNVVMKRNYSDCSDCVVLGSMDDDIKDSLWASAAESSKRYTDLTDFVKLRWFCQPYVPTLLSFGELRTFLVGGVIQYIIHTSPVEVKGSVTQVNLVVPLEKLGSRNCQELYDEPLPLDELQEGHRVFTEFIHNQLRALIVKEESVTNRMSSYRIFCRLDVGVFKDCDGTYHFMVNEAERSISTYLFGCEALVKLEIMMAGFTRLLHAATVGKWFTSDEHKSWFG